MDDSEEFRLSCAECGHTAVTILIVPPVTPLPQRHRMMVPLPPGEWRYEVQALGLGGMNTTVSAEGAALLKQAVETGDLGYLLRLEYPIPGAVCRECRAVYCTEHMTVEKVLEAGGAPMYDYYYAKLCCRGHRGTFERL